MIHTRVKLYGIMCIYTQLTPLMAIRLFASSPLRTFIFIDTVVCRTPCQHHFFEFRIGFGFSLR